MEELSKAFYLKIQLDEYWDLLHESYRSIESVLKQHGLNPKSYSHGQIDNKDAVVIYNPDILWELDNADVYADELGLVTGKYYGEAMQFLSFHPKSKSDRDIVKSLSKVEKEEILHCFLQMSYYHHLIENTRQKYVNLRDKITAGGKKQTEQNKGRKRRTSSVPLVDVNESRSDGEHAIHQTIFWGGDKSKLLQLYRLLREEGLVGCTKKELFLCHFSIEPVGGSIEGKTRSANGKKSQNGKTRRDVEQGKIQWLGDTVLLVYLFEKLFNHDMLSIHKDYKRRFSVISKHFVDQNGRVLNNKLLSQSQQNYLQNKKSKKKPRNATIIDDIVDSL